MDWQIYSTLKAAQRVIQRAIRKAHKEFLLLWGFSESFIKCMPTEVTKCSSLPEKSFKVYQMKTSSSEYVGIRDESGSSCSIQQSLSHY